MGGNESAGIVIDRSYSAAPSISSTGFTSGNGVPFGFVGSRAVVPVITNTFLYQNANVPADNTSGLVTYTTSTQMQTQSNFTNFDFTTPVWKMPSANPFAAAPYTTYSPALLSPVLNWQCGTNGITCP